MSESAEHLPYHRRYRPKKLSEYIGNDRIKKGVLSALRNKIKPQVVLMTGHAGTGKTTMARLLGKEYLCEDRDPVVGACGKCHSCQMLDEYIETGDPSSLMNVREIDVTDSNKRKDMDELLEDAQVPSFDGSWKVFVLDECHMMTNSAQNRLLKSLEEPAEKVLMILCTTDPQKLLETILSRCQYVFKVQKPSRDELGNLMARILQKEEIQYDAKALNLICVKGDFVPRKSLVALEQVVREKKRVTYEETVEVLDLVADKYFFTFYSLLLKEPINVFEYITFLGDLKASMDLRQFLDSLLSFTTRGIYVSHGAKLEGLDKSEINQYKRIFNQFSSGDIAFLLSVLLDIKNSSDVETKLLLLGYTGLKRGVQSSSVGVGQDGSTGLNLADSSGVGISQEKEISSKNHLDSITMTESEKDEFVKKQTETVDAVGLAELFGGTIIEND